MPPSIGDTPAERAVKGDKTSQWVRDRVEAKSPRGDRCIIEGFSGEKAINLCHVFPRCMTGNDRIMTAIEYKWGKKIPGATPHWMHDHARFALVPSTEVLDAFLDPENHPDNTDGLPNRATFANAMEKAKEHATYLSTDTQHKTPIFTYTLVPLTEKIADVIFVHEHEHPHVSGDPKVSAHQYPFRDFPKIESHIQPQFVLLSLGLTLFRLKLNDKKLEKMQEDFSTKDLSVPFVDILRLYKFWTLEDPNWKDDKTFCDAGHPSPKAVDDLKDKTYRPSGSVASSIRTQQKRDHNTAFDSVNILDEMIDGRASPTPSFTISDLGSTMSKRQKVAASLKSSKGA
ncbi:hypothetical protein FA13DRAFT_1711951 [Coprinellus micaceus]|uniref:HNH nuclease domain-containing protein n=1 Tax=Coprinellus micaceus TaxID=71717 RepID=A0A4Y7T295_COPMI|nr:hypothetical protein FA13DRAFT_1711951 [Coprinellus micaceus]